MATSLPLITPFGTEPLDDVPLPRAPLAQTLTQIAFPAQSALVIDGEIASELSRRLRPFYPVFQTEQQVNIVITPDGVTQNEGAQVWRLASKDETWQVHVTPTFLTLTTTSYTGHEDFCSRLDEAWQGFCEVIGGEPAINRIGFRYINRVDDRAFLDSLTAMVHPAVTGALFAGNDVAPIARGITENQYVVTETDRLQARWGLLPPGDTFDPFTLPPHSLTSWVLDLDSFRYFGSPQALSDNLAAIVEALSRTAYRYFRWSVTDEFLKFFGGDA